MKIPFNNIEKGIVMTAGIATLAAVFCNSSNNTKNTNVPNIEQRVQPIKQVDSISTKTLKPILEQDTFVCRGLNSKIGKSAIKCIK